MTAIHFIRTAPVSDQDNVMPAAVTGVNKGYAMTLDSAGSALDQTLTIKAPAENTWDLLTAGSAIPSPGHIKFRDTRTNRIYRIATFESVHDR